MTNTDKSASEKQATRPDTAPTQGTLDEYNTAGNDCQDSGESDDSGLYDPTDEYDELEETSDISGWGAGRRKALAAIDAKDRLDDPQSFDCLEDMLNAVREISLAHPDGRLHIAPPEKPLTRIEAAYNDLPDDAQQEYLNDHRLYVKIRAARNRFNDWMGKERREQEMPSWVEAGPSKYPTEKAQKRSKYAREAREELDEAIGKIAAAANGAKQRALESIGSSVAEHNAEKAEAKADSVKEQLEPGDIVFCRDTVYGLVPWGVKRLNEKSVRLRRPHKSAGQPKPMSNGEYPEYDHTTVDYDSNFLELTSRDEWEDIDPEAIDGDVDSALLDGYESAIRYLMGDDWVDETLDEDLRAEETTAPSNDEPEYSEDEKEAIREAVSADNFADLIRIVHSDKPLVTNDWEWAGIESIEDMLEHYDEEGNFQIVSGVGPVTSESIEAAIPVIKDVHESSGS